MDILLKFHIFFWHRHSPDQVLDNFLNKTHPMQWWPQQQNPRKNPHNKHIDERQKCYFLSKNNFFPDDFFNSQITLQIFNLGKKNNINAKDLLNWNILEQQHQSLRYSVSRYESKSVYMSTTYILTFIQCIVLNLGEINRIPEIHAKI